MALLPSVQFLLGSRERLKRRVRRFERETTDSVRAGYADVLLTLLGTGSESEFINST